MKNKAYDIEFWRKPGETDAETRERVYRQCKNLNVYNKYNGMIEIIEESFEHFWKWLLSTFIILIYIPIFVFTTPYHIGREVIIRYLILLRIGAITWYGKRTGKVSVRFELYQVCYAKMRERNGNCFLAKVKIIETACGDNVQVLDDDYNLDFDSISSHFVSYGNMWATIEEAERATGLEYKFKQN